MRNFYFDPTYDKYQNPDGFTALKATIANQVMILAAAGQILPKYKRYDEAIKVANYFVNSDNISKKCLIEGTVSLVVQLVENTK